MSRENLLVAEDFIERLCSSALDVFHRFLPETVESSRDRTTPRQKRRAA